MEQQNKLYVGNFPFSWKEDDLEQVFSEFKDNITDIKIIYDQYSGRSKGFAFITFDDDAAANKALQKADSPAGERTLVVSHARPPSQRTSFERGDRGDRGDRGPRGPGRGHDRGDRGGRQERRGGNGR